MQQTHTLTSEETQYKFQTNTFTLELNITCEKLTIKLKDFIDWIVYEKQYTNDDIGKGQIHQISDIFDLYNILTLRVGLDDEQKVEELAENEEEIKQYIFGEIMQIRNIECYKIQRGGKITVYLNLTAEKLKKKVNCDSHLVLSKVRDMSQIQISTCRAQTDKKIWTNMLMKKIEKFKQENKEMKKKYDFMNEELNSMKQVQQKIIDQNNSMKEEIKLLKQQGILIRKQCSSKLEQMRKQLINMTKKLEQSQIQESKKLEIHKQKRENSVIHEQEQDDELYL